MTPSGEYAVHLVVGNTGEYSDRQEWFLSAYEDKAEADAKCAALNAAAEGIEHLRDEARDRAQLRLLAHDAQAVVDYTGTWYEVVEIGVCRAKAEGR